MNVKKTVPVSDFCPYLDGVHTAYATIQKINMCGDSTDYARCVSFSCDYSSECDKTDECPLLTKAQSIQLW